MTTYRKQNIVLIIPALNEELGIAAVLKSLPPSIFSDIVVCDNGSTDKTAEIASSNGASVVFEPRRGYGSACLCAISYLKNKNYPDPIDLITLRIFMPFLSLLMTKKWNL